MHRLKLVLIAVGAAAVFGGVGYGGADIATGDWPGLAAACVAIGAGAGLLVVAAPEKSGSNAAMAWGTLCGLLAVAVIVTGIWTFVDRTQDANNDRRDADRRARTEAEAGLVKACVTAGGSWIDGNCVMPNITVGSAPTVGGDR